MTRTANFLAALASAALPGLDPTSVQIVRRRPDDLFDVAYVVDTKERQWVVQAPRTPVAGALLEDVAELSTLLGRRLDIAIPAIHGQVVVPEGRAVVHPRLPGRPLDFARLPEGLGLASDVGRALAHVHNLEIALFEEAGRPSYDAEATRTRRLTDLDRAAATGHVPTGLLARWERSLEDVSLWRFAPTPVHGSFTGSNVLASFADEDDADHGRVAALLGWEDAHVGDPAEDFAELTSLASPAALRSVIEAYGPSRVDRPDRHLVARARLGAEMAVVRRLLVAVAADAAGLIDEVAQDLRSLDEHVFAASGDTGGNGSAGDWARIHDSQPLDPGTAGPPVESSDAGRPEVRARPEEPTGEPPHHSVTAPRPGPAAGDIATVAVPLAEIFPPDAHQHGPVASDAHDITDAAAPPSDTPENPLADAAAGTLASADEAPATAAVPPLSAVHFEIDEAEPLDDGLLDLHEGASDFVPVEQRPRGPGSSGAEG